MAAISIGDFSGIVPAKGEVYLAPNQATLAQNVKLDSGELRPWFSDASVFTVFTLTAINTIYRFDGPVGNTPPHVWLTWSDDVDIVRGPVADTTALRLYYTGANFAPRKTDWMLATGNNTGGQPFPNNYYEMGVPAPTTAPVAAVQTAGTGDPETRVYVFTYVTEFGGVINTAIAEESAPSPPVTITTNSVGSTIRLNGFGSPPAGNYNFKYRRIYRTLSGGSYQLVAEIPIATTQYDDSKTATQLGVGLASTFYTPPPSGLRGLVAMPNGILAGFVGNQIWFCEPYKPHAWPSSYMLTVDSEIVGLGVFGNSLFVGTKRHPYVVTGSTPQTMSQEKLPLMQPCISKRSIASDQYGVIYASPNGLVSIGSGVQDVLTDGLFTRDEWRQLNPTSMSGVLYNNRYIGWYYTTTPPYFRGLVLQRGARPSLSTLSFPGNASFVDPNGNLFAYSGGDNGIYNLDLYNASTEAKNVYEWRSKKFLFNKPTSFAAFKLQADYLARRKFPNLYVEVSIYCDDDLHHVVRVENDGVVRIPGGVRGSSWQFVIKGTLNVRQLLVGSSVEELKQVATP